MGGVREASVYGSESLARTSPLHAIKRGAFGGQQSDQLCCYEGAYIHRGSMGKGGDVYGEENVNTEKEPLISTKNSSYN